MATTEDRMEQLSALESESEPADHDVAALEDSRVAVADVPPAAADNGSPVAVPSRSLPGRLSEPITEPWAAIAAVAWVVLLGIGIAVEPSPANPDAVDPWVLDALGTMLLATVASAFAGFWRRQRWSLVASLVASGLLVVSTLACPASGHHPQIGAWWVVQLGCGLGLVTTSILGLRRA
jgi:hypothetical protein